MSANKRGPECHVCKHRELAAINLALARGVSPRAIAKRYEIGEASLYRHARRPHCLPPQLKAKLIAGPSIAGVDLDKVKETESQSLLMHLIGIRNRLFAALDSAEEMGDGGMLSRVVGQIHHNLELTGKLLGDLGVGSTTINNVLVLPAYVEMRVELVKALAPFPAARQAVAKVLHALEGKAAKDIVADTRVLEFSTSAKGPPS
jgi:hypothetical protein